MLEKEEQKEWDEKVDSQEQIYSFLNFEDKEFTRQMTLIEFYEIAEDIIISLQYFNFRQKERTVYQRLGSLGMSCAFKFLEKANKEMDEL